jgi:hypothetical protein
MGLLDSLLSGSQGGYGGLLDALMYQSPLTQKPADAPLPVPSGPIDPRSLIGRTLTMFGNPPPVNAAPAPNPFGPPPTFAPPSPFDTGAAPTQFASPSQPQAPILPLPQTVTPAPQPPQQPTSMVNVGNYQMPQFGSAPQTAQAPSTDISAQGRQPEAPVSLPPALAGTNILGRLGSPDGLIARLTGNDSRSIAQQNLQAQFSAIQQTLILNGDSPQQASSKAMVAVMNPEAAKTILPELFTNKEKFGVVSDNPIEGKKYGFVNERDQTINGKPLGQGAATGDQSGGMLAPGVQFDSSKTGDAYLGQFSPEVQAAVKSYINGDVMPTGNPRQQGIANVAKTIAQKYGQNTGIPVSDTLYAEKRKYRTELGTNSPNSAGGQAKAFNQGISHMVSLADNLEKLDNSNGLGIPIVAQGVNAVRQGFSNQQSAIADEAKALGQTIAGEVGKLFSGSAGGGVHERELTRGRFDTVKSKPQLAAALRATLETMQGGLSALEQRRDSILGPNSGVDLVSDATRQNIAKIQGTIDRLEGRSSGNQTKTGVTWSIVK